MKVNTKSNIIIFVLCFVIICVSSICCSCANNPPKINVADNVLPSVTILSDDSDINDAEIFYIVDDKTGVVYLGFSQYYRAGITVMLNPDGSPVMYDQIK